jgi:proteasome assembly chaperone (PAC2) family protein
MNGLKKEAGKVERAPVEIYRTPRLQSPSIIVSWQTQDIGKCSLRVVDFIIEKLEAQEVAEIKPSGFFSFGGIRFGEDLVQVQESKFWACEKNNLLIFKSDEPEFEHYWFLNVLLDMAEQYFQIKEIYTLSGTVALTAHTYPRRVLTVFNQKGIKEKLEGCGLEYMTWKGPPAINSYLLWVAKRRGVPGVSLWPEIPFYLAAREDPQAMKAVLNFFNKRFSLHLDLEWLDRDIIEQAGKLVRLREENPQIDGYIHRLENGLTLSEEEQLTLVREVYEVLRT